MDELIDLSALYIVYLLCTNLACIVYVILFKKRIETFKNYTYILDSLMLFVGKIIELYGNIRIQFVFTIEVFKIKKIDMFRSMIIFNLCILKLCSYQITA